MDQYEDEFIAAVRRTYAADLPVPLIQHHDGRFLTDRGIDALYRLIPLHLGAIAPRETIGQCILLHTVLLPHVRRVFGNAYLTIGYPQKDDQRVYHVTETDIDRWLAAGLQDDERQRGIDLHVWITLPTMEIIDITGVFAGVNTDGMSYVGGVVRAHPADLCDGLSYHPLMVGPAFLHRIGAVVVYPWGRAGESMPFAAEPPMDRAQRLALDATTPEVILALAWIDVQAPRLFALAARESPDAADRGLLIIDLGTTPVRELEHHPPFIEYLKLTDLARSDSESVTHTTLIQRLSDYHPDCECMVVVRTADGDLGPFHAWKPCSNG